MRSSLFEKSLLFLIRLGLVLILFSPLIYSNDFFFPFIVPRATFFQLFTEIIFILTIVLIYFFPAYRPKWNGIYRGLTIFFIVGVITTLTSFNPIKSFTGTIERYFGFFHILHYFALFFALVTVLRTAKQWHLFLWASLLISIYGAIDFIIPTFFGSYKALSPSVAGNPSFFAAYLLFHLCFSAILIAKTKKQWLQALLGLVIILLAAAILATNVRGAFLGLMFGAFYIVAWLAWKMPKLRIHFATFILLCIAVYALLFVNRASQLVRENYVLQRITNFSLQDQTLQARFAMWRMAFSGFKERPLFGFGRENFSVVFNRYFDPSFDDARVGERWEDRTHNVFFDELVNGGLIQLAAYILLIIVAFRATNRGILLQATLVSYIIQNLVGVDTLNSYLPFFIFLAYLFFNAQSEQHMDSKLLQQPAQPLKKHYAVAVVCVSFLAVFASFTVTMRIASGNAMIHTAVERIFGNDYLGFDATYKRGKELFKNTPTLTAEALTIISTVIIQNNNAFTNPDAYRLFISPIMNDFEQLVQQFPMEQRFAVLLGQLYMTSSAVTRDIAYLDKTDTLYGKLHAASPQRKLFVDAAALALNVRQQLTSLGQRNP